jgi:DnaK suppressor protein
MAKTQALSPSQLRELRSDMERELAWLLRSLTKRRPNGAGLSRDASRDARLSEHDEMEQLLRDRGQQRLAAIVAALARMDNGAYGVCVSCRTRIPYGRLIMMPEATHCIACGGRSSEARTHSAALGNVQHGGVT